MDFFRRLFDRLFPPQRDVSRLGGDADEDQVYEAVDTSGGPLKPNHRRQALRDRKLLPKRSRNRKRKLFTRQQAERLFSPSLRTGDRHLRDLLPDEDQLKRLGLPRWRSDDELAQALGLSTSQLYHYSQHRQRDTVDHYVTFAIAKRGGGERLIMAPKKRLKALLRALDQLLVSRLPQSEFAHGFVKGRSTRTGAEPHLGRAVLLQLDLADFFPSVTFARVRGLLVALGYGYPVATTLALLMTACPRQPVVVDDRRYHVPVGERHCVQGAPTSPGLCNAVVVRLDRRLAGLARKLGFTYTRYADDLTFSGDDLSKLPGLRRLARQIIAEEGFRIRPDKTRIRRQGGRQVVTGVIVNQQLGAPRELRRKLRAELHQLGSDPTARAQALGRLAYVHMLNPEQAAKLRRDAGL